MPAPQLLAIEIESSQDNYPIRIFGDADRNYLVRLDQHTKPDRKARTAAWVRSSTHSLLRMLRT